MRGSQVAVIVGGCAVIVTAGFASAPPLKIVGAEPASTPQPTATSGPGTAEPTAAPGVNDPAAEPQTFAGPPVSNPRGTYQAQITVVDGVVTDVVALEAGTSAAQSVQVNQMAIPLLKEEVLEAQTWDVAAISGASFTSPAFIESLQGAFADAGL
jgi:uncharacterized protein with FMN-binding domain